MAIDDSTGEPDNLMMDDFRNLYVRSVPSPTSSAPGRTRFEAVVTHAAANVTVLAAPGAGKRIIITDYILAAFNTSTGTMGQLHLRETGTGGTVKIPHSMPSAASLSASAQLVASHAFLEPITLAENVALFLHFATANVTGSLTVSGFVEDV